MIYLTPILYAYVLWLLFLAVMALQWRWHALPRAVKAIALPAVIVAVVLDVLFNFTVGCVVFLKLPEPKEWGIDLHVMWVPFVPVGMEWTFSQRVGNYKKRIDWRAPLANWICTNLLDPFEAGGHCK